MVKVRQNQTKTEFITEYERSQQTLDMKPLSKLPAGLDDVFVVKYKAEPFNWFIDYDVFFQSAIMLHDGILKPFLAKLKCHIEIIHVCLGKIESWLVEPNRNIELLETTFGKKLKIPTTDDLDNGKVIHVLKSCNESGKFEKTFTIAKQSDQIKLKKFLEFMAS